MGLARAARRRVVAVEENEDGSDATSSARFSGDGDDNDVDGDGGDDDDDDEEPVRSARRLTAGSSGKLKPVRRGTRAPLLVAGSQRSQHSQQSQDSQQSRDSQQSQNSPKNPGKAKSKPKLSGKEGLKPASKPIYSFFNAATQRQQSAQPPAASQSKPSTPRHDAETIESGDERAGELAFSKGSSTALALRKRKFQQSQRFEDETRLPLPATQKFRKTSDGGRTPSFSVANDDKRPWVEQFAPTNLAELAVHKRKVGDVRQWLEAAYSGKRQKVLVLKGAAGTGKTATIDLIAKEMGVEVLEWRNPAGSDHLAEGSASTASQFDEFIARAGKSGGLLFAREGETDLARDESALPSPDESPTDRKQLLLIEEFPNTFSKTSPVLQSFRSTLCQYLASPPLNKHPPTPIVLVVSETLLSTITAAADSFTVHRLLGPELLSHPYVDTIEFNAVAPTILIKALEGIVIKEARKSGRRMTPGPVVLKHLAETGDIRSAVSSLEFLCLRGDDGDTWSSKVVFTKAKKAKNEPGLTKAEEEALKLISNRESSLGIFHSVGKVVYNKRVDPIQAKELAQPPPWLPQHYRCKVSETDVDRLIDELGTDTSTFVAALHENYALSCICQDSEESLDSLCGCIESISDSDLLSLDRFSFGTRAFSGSATDTLRQDEMSFQVAVRGLLFNLPCPVHRGVPLTGKKSDAHRMFYPASLKMWRKKEEIEGTLDMLTAKVQSGELDGPLLHPGQSTGRNVGVVSWKRAAAGPSTDNVHTTDSTLAKAEMLIERLPYMAQIMEASNTRLAAFEQVMHVVRVTDSTLPTADEDEDQGSVGLGMGQPAEQWATDRPDVEASEQLRGTRKRNKGLASRATEGGGLAIPVESSVAKLVLEDDDIVDD